jgi:hypothetical protein
MPHNAWDAGNLDVGLAGELGWDSFSAPRR